MQSLREININTNASNKYDNLKWHKNSDIFNNTLRKFSFHLNYSTDNEILYKYTTKNKYIEIFWALKRCRREPRGSSRWTSLKESAFSEIDRKRAREASTALVKVRTGTNQSAGAIVFINKCRIHLLSRQLPWRSFGNHHHRWQPLRCRWFFESCSKARLKHRVVFSTNHHLAAW